MKFKFVKQVTGEVPSYNGNVVKTGDVIELEGHFAGKAANNPDYEIFEYLGGHTTEEGTIASMHSNNEEVRIVAKYQKNPTRKAKVGVRGRPQKV